MRLFLDDSEISLQELFYAVKKALDAGEHIEVVDVLYNEMYFETIKEETK